MENLIFVTGNINKGYEIEERFNREGIPIQIVEINFQEPEINDIEFINNDDINNQSEGEDFELGIKKLGMALLSNQILDMLYVDKGDLTNIDRELEIMEKKTATDIDSLVRFYIHQVLLGGSDFVITKGYKGLRDILNKEQLRKDEQKSKKE